MFALLLRYFVTANADSFGPVPMMIEIVAIASILVGNLLALLQNNLKRILAYSSIAHLGYLLVAFLAGGALRIEAVTYYLVAYSVMTFGAFGIITVLSASNAAAEVEDLDALSRLDLAAPMARRHLCRDAAIARRHSADNGFYRQVLCDCRRG